MVPNICYFDSSKAHSTSRSVPLKFQVPNDLILEQRWHDQERLFLWSLSGAGECLEGIMTVVAYEPLVTTTYYLWISLGYLQVISWCNYRVYASAWQVWGLGQVSSLVPVGTPRCSRCLEPWILFLSQAVAAAIRHAASAADRSVPLHEWLKACLVDVVTSSGEFQPSYLTKRATMTMRHVPNWSKLHTIKPAKMQTVRRIPRRPLVSHTSFLFQLFQDLKWIRLPLNPGFEVVFLVWERDWICITIKQQRSGHQWLSTK